MDSTLTWRQRQSMPPAAPPANTPRDPPTPQLRDQRNIRDIFEIKMSHPLPMPVARLRNDRVNGSADPVYFHAGDQYRLAEMN
jgi:hypothetical protein